MFGFHTHTHTHTHTNGIQQTRSLVPICINRVNFTGEIVSREPTTGNIPHVTVLRGRGEGGEGGEGRGGKGGEGREGRGGRGGGEEGKDISHILSPLPTP